MSLHVEHVHKSYSPGKKVLNDLSLSLVSGETYALVGPNGAGKSTTIKCIIGAVSPQEGRLLYNNKSLDHLKESKGLSYLPESLILPRSSTMQEYLSAVALLKGIPEIQARELLQELAKKLDMDKVLNKRIGTFSKGMRKKVGVIQAFLGKAELIILDEPTSDLDPVARRAVLSLVADAKAGGTSVLMTSHILTDLERVCDRAGLLYGGRLVSEIVLAEYRRDSRVASARLENLERGATLTLALGNDCEIAEGRYRFADLDYATRDLEDWYHDCLEHEGALP